MGTAPVSFLPNATTPVVLPLSEGDQGTIETVRTMWALIQDGMRDPEVNRLAMAIVNASPARPFNFADQRRALFDWFSRYVRFVRDIAGKETLRTPRETLAVRAGDCDDMTMALAALLGTIGNDVRIVTIGVLPATAAGAAPFSHVYAEVFDGRQWVAIDPARPGARWGRAPERYTRKRIWFSTGDFQDEGGNVSGLAGFLSAPNVFANRRGFRRRGLRGLDFDWSGLAQTISAGGTAASNIIRSVNNPYYGGAAMTLTPAQQQALLANQYPSSAFSVTGLSTVPSWMWIAGGLLFALVLVKR